MKKYIISFLKANWVNFIAFVFVFVGAFLLLTSQWIKIQFGDEAVRDFGTILFIAQFPLLGNGIPLVASFLLGVVLPSFLIAFCIAWANLSIRFIKFIYGLVSKISTSKITAFKVIFAIALFALCTNITINRFRIKDFLNAQTQYSQLYEEHYKNFDSATLKDFTPTQNLIVIFVESLETNLAQVTQKFVGGGGGNSLNLIPNLEKIANENISFSINDKFGGISQVFGTNGTASGIIGYLCGIPQNRFSKSKYFLGGATCISDVLKDLGYKQSFIGGTDFSFAGKRDFLQTHNIEVMDLKYFQNKGILPKKLPKDMQGVWDLKDVKTFELAKNHLEQINSDSPFALYVLTVDTHEQRGYVDKEYCPNLDNTYESAYLCTDSIVSDFIAYLQNSKFKDNTTIIILGDHLKRTDFVKMPPGSKTIYNAFINAKWSKTPANTLVKGRLFSHFDITPLILDSIGLRVEAFALGRNLLYENSLLEDEFYSIGDFNAVLKLRNKVYDGFWIGK